MTKKKIRQAAPRGTTPDFIYQNLKAEILSGNLGAGQQLRQAEIADRFGTSRIPVREALRQLAAEGLVDFNLRRGAVVSTLSVGDVVEIFDIRLGLEARALRLAIPGMVEDDLERAAEVIEACERSDDPGEWSDLNWTFHATLYAPANRPRLFELIEQTFENMARFFRVQVSIARGKERPQREHREILAACRAGDVDGAVALLEDHIAHTQKIVAATGRNRTFSLLGSSTDVRAAGGGR